MKTKTPSVLSADQDEPSANPSGRLWTNSTTKTNAERRTWTPLNFPTCISRPAIIRCPISRKATPITPPKISGTH